MKIGKYILAGLLVAAVVLPVSAQDKQYDVKLTVYSKEDQAKAKADGKECKKGGKGYISEPRADRKAAKAERSIARAVPAEPVKIEPAESGKPYVSVRPVEEKPKQPVRPRESYDPVVVPAGDKKCGEACDKPCCRDKAYGKHAFLMSPGGMPMFCCNAQYRDFNRTMFADFAGDAFYLGTNVLAYAALAPNMSLEWRRDESVGFRLGFGGFYWPWAGGESRDNTYGFWGAPEVRFYLGQQKAWYAGPMLQFGYLGRCFDNSAYGNEHYVTASVGGTFGYMQRVKRNFAVDYNIGVGVSGIGYYDGRDANPGTDWKCAFSLTNIGISLVWQACNKPLK